MITFTKTWKRNSICEPEFRELLVGVRQQKEHLELALESLVESESKFYDFCSRYSRMPTVTGERYKESPISRTC